MLDFGEHVVEGVREPFELVLGADFEWCCDWCGVECEVVFGCGFETVLEVL